MTTRFCLVPLAFFGTVATTFADPPDVAGIVKQIEAKRGKIVLDGKGMPVEVYLYNKAFSDADLALLKPFSGLRLLNLQHARITDASVEQIVAAHPSLESINIHDTKITPACLKHLAKLKSLRTLEIYNWNVTDDMIREMRAHNLLHVWRQASKWTTARPTSPAEVQQLHLDGTKVTPAGLKEISRIKSLRHLNVKDTRVTAAGLKHVAGLPLTSLDVSPGILTDETLQFLRDNKMLHVLANARGKGGRPASLDSIIFMSLDDAPITDASVKHLLAMKSLVGVNLRRTRVSDKGVAELKTALPKVRINR